MGKVSCPLTMPYCDPEYYDTTSYWDGQCEQYYCKEKEPTECMDLFPEPTWLAPCPVYDMRCSREETMEFRWDDNGCEIPYCVSKECPDISGVWHEPFVM